MMLSPRGRTQLLTIHVIATVSVLGTDLALLALGVAGLRGADPRTVYPAAHLVGQWLIAPLAVTSLATGLLLGALTPWGLLRHWWVTAKLAITTVLTGVVLVVLVPGLGRTADATTGPAPAGVTHAQQIVNVAAPAAATGLLTLNVILGMFKPGLRRRLHPGTPAVTTAPQG